MCGTFRSVGLPGDWNAQVWILEDGTFQKNIHYLRPPDSREEYDEMVPSAPPALIRESTTNQYFFVFDAKFPPSLEVIRRIGKLVVSKDINSPSFSDVVTLYEAFPELDLPEGPNIYYESIPGQPVTMHIWSEENMRTIR